MMEENNNNAAIINDLLSGKLRLAPTAAPPPDRVTQIKQQTWAAQERDLKRAQERQMEAARQKQARMQTQLEQERKDAMLTRSVQLEAEAQEADLQEYLQCGGHPSDHDKIWPKRWQEIMDSRVGEMHRRARDRIAQYL